MKHEKGGSPTSSRSDVPKCRATAQGVGAVVDKLTTEPGECHCGSHKGCEVTLLRVVSKLVFLKPCNCFSPTSILAVFCCNRDDLIGCVHPKGILPEAFLRYHPKSPETLASRMFHSVSRSCLATPSVAVPTCQNIAGHVILGSNGRIQNWRATCWGATYWNILCLSINQALLLLSERKHGCHTRKPEHGVIRTYQGYPELVWFKHKSPSGHVNNPEANRMWNIYAIQFWWVAFLYVMQFPKVDLNHLTVSIRKQVVGLSFKSTITTSDYVMEAAAHTKFQLSDCILSQCLFFDGRPRYCWLIYELPVCCRTKNRVRSLLLTSQTCSIIFVVLKQFKPHFCRLK